MKRKKSVVKRLYHVFNMGENIPYFEPDAVKVDKIKEICRWKMARLNSKGEEVYGDQEDKLIDIVIYPGTIKSKVKSILSLMVRNDGYKSKDIAEILKGK